MIDVSLIIVNYRGWSHLEKCLDAFVLFQGDQFSFEVIVVDNCSNDGQLALFQKRFPAYSFILNSGNNGFSNGCNLGASSAKGKYILFLNPDILASESAILALLQTIRRNPEFMILSCKQINDNGREEQTCRLFPSFLTLNGILRAFYRKLKQKELSIRLTVEQEIANPDWVSGSVVLISKQDFVALGGWDESYWLYYEDVDLCLRVVKLGGKVGLCNHIDIVHNHGGATRINLRTAVLTKTEVVISLHVFLSKHYSAFHAVLLHFMVILEFLLGNLIPAMLGIPLFFIKRLNLYTRLYFKVLSYYLFALVNCTWLSPRSVKYK